MRTFLFFFLALRTLTLCAQAITPVPAPNTYVWARSGLNLRKTPDFKGEKIATLPYGTPVVATAYAQTIKGSNDFGDFEEPVMVTLEAIKSPSENDKDAGYKIEGSWVKVQAAGKEGYLFDAYLSAMTPCQALTAPDLAKNPTVPQSLADFKAYASAQWGILQESDTHAIFANSAFVRSSKRHPVFARWVFPEMNDHDGYLLANFFFALEKKANGDNPERFEFNGATKEMLGFFFDSGTNCELNIFFFQGAMILESVWGGD